MRENNDLGIFDFDDFAMEMTSTEQLLVNGGACGGGSSGFGEPELKFICADGREAVFTKDFSEDGSYQLYTDPRYKGTYNYCNPNGFLGYIGHFFADMVPYYLTGNSNERNQ